MNYIQLGKLCTQFAISHQDKKKKEQEKEPEFLMPHASVLPNSMSAVDKVKNLTCGKEPQIVISYFKKSLSNYPPHKISRTYTER